MFAWYTLPTVYDQQKLLQLFQVFAHNIRRNLRDAGLRCHRPFRGQPLLLRNRLARRHWATAHARCRLNIWDSVIFFYFYFFDETKVIVDLSDRRQRVYRRRGESFRDNCVVEEERSGIDSLYE
jgi:hypothetical protein